MSSSDEGTLEILIKELGSFGRFQVILMQCLFIPKAFLGFSLVLPSFTAVSPDWWCVPTGANHNQSQHTNVTFKACHVNGTVCVREYASNMVTTVSEWDLVCDSKWVTKMITSIQMAGILVGVVVAGQLSDTIGRRKVFFSALLMHSVWNFICPFSVSWEMFTVLRFLIGLEGGMILCSCFPYVLEFCEDRWRPILTAIPYWSMGVCLFALLAWLIPNWKYLHGICGALNLPFVIGYFFLPESMRWLVVHDRLEEAGQAADIIARYNRTTKPADILERFRAVAHEEKNGRHSVKKYSYIDVFRGKTMIKTTLCSAFVWGSCSIVYYGMTFGAHGLSGNLYLNIFLLAIVEFPSCASTFWFLRIFGRKWTTISFLLIGGISLVGTVVTNATAGEDYKDQLITALALIAKMSVGGAWMIMYTYTNELYPTVIRSIGFGVSQMCARVAGILAPIILLMDGDNIIVPYVTMGILIIISAVCLFMLPETKGRPLEDTLKTKAKDEHIELENNDETKGRPLEDTLKTKAKDERIELENNDETKGRPLEDTLKTKVKDERIELENNDETKGRPPEDNLKTKAKDEHIELENNEEIQGRPLEDTLKTKAKDERIELENNDETKGRPLEDTLKTKAKDEHI